ncbi:capsule biosynthesis protein [Sphingomonas limnosediminicola]|uniref:Capsule biosynthesis protein n=1 Tax=Sphingomonas limnosediminicola TaxID=940133 RepID=A0ABP7L746_9SPHN
MNSPVHALVPAGDPIHLKALVPPRRIGAPVPHRAFLFLQGPPGPLFRKLGARISQQGYPVYRINLNGGDLRDWRDPTANFCGRFSQWPVFFDKFLREHRITDIVLFGDCRPYHVSAHGVAGMRHVRTHVLEEGYLRPHWMTLEPEGVNARSTLSRDKTWFREEARRLSVEPNLAPVTASFRRRARDSYWHYHAIVTGLLRFPHYRPHRSSPIIIEGLGWLWKFACEKKKRERAQAVMRALKSKSLFVLPLQLSGDFQIRAHSPFPDMQGAASFVIESFAAHAPEDVHLLLKAHPLDCSFFRWDKFVQAHAERLGLTQRLHFVDGGDLDDMVACARGLVCVNSTSATLALAKDTPVCTIGEAIYDMPGLTHQGHLDTFWLRPTPPEPGLYKDFRRVLVDRCLVRGGLASESAVATLVEGLAERLCSQPLVQSVAIQASMAAK